MLRAMLKSKIHGARVTQTELHYEGSITLPSELAAAAGVLDGEQVDVVSVNNGTRITTYVIVDEAGSRAICLNGPAARTGIVGDQIHILGYGLFDDTEARALTPTTVHVDEQNRIASE